MVSVLAGKPSQTGDGKEREMCYARANAAWCSEDKESRKNCTRTYRMQRKFFRFSMELGNLADLFVKIHPGNRESWVSKVDRRNQQVQVSKVMGVKSAGCSTQHVDYELQNV